MDTLDAWLLLPRRADREHHPLDPSILENEFYAPGIGPVLELDVSPTIASAVRVRKTR